MNRILRKSAACLLILIFASAGLFSACTQNTSDNAAMLSLIIGKDGQEERLDCFANKNGEYYLFLPGGTPLSELTVSLGGRGSVTVDGKRVKDGSQNTVLTKEGVYELVADGQSYKLNLLISSEIPAVFINTESGNLNTVHADKNNKESGYFRVFESGVNTAGCELDYIKGRGNSTWLADKKSYTIKLSEKTSLFGMEKAKKWCLIANAYDNSLIRNSVALTIAKEMGIFYTCDFQPVDLWVNGCYEGSYLLTEKIETGSGRVDITDLDKANEEANPGVNIDDCEQRTETVGEGFSEIKYTDIPIDPENITGGYLLEYDTSSFYRTETAGFATSQGQYVTMHSPDTPTRAETEYIHDFCEKAEEALLSDDGRNSEGKSFDDYYDMNSLAKMYILQEYLQNFEVGASSCYFAKEQNSELLVAVCPWDFDSCAGNYTDEEVGDLLSEKTRCLPTVLIDSKTCLPTVFALAFRHSSFRECVKSEWKENEQIFGRAVEIAENCAELLGMSAACDYFRWNTLFIQTPAERLSVWRDKYVGELCDYLNGRLYYADAEFTGNNALLFYDLTEGSGYIVSEQMTFVGGEAVVKDAGDGLMFDTVPPDGQSFLCWNTEKDGSGESFLPGDKIKLTDNITYLYAVWN